jgi:hypothetical protein
MATDNDHDQRVSDARGTHLDFAGFRTRHVQCSMYSSVRVYKHDPDCQHQDEEYAPIESPRLDNPRVEPRELHCEECDRDYPVWVAPSPLWNAVVREPSDAAGRTEPFLCLTCFAMRAERSGVRPLDCRGGAASRSSRSASHARAATRAHAIASSEQFVHKLPGVVPQRYWHLGHSSGSASAGTGFAKGSPGLPEPADGHRFGGAWLRQILFALGPDDPSRRVRRAMARKSGAARAAEGDELELDYAERDGFLTGRNAAIQDWRFRKEQQEGDFQRLVWRLQAKKYWAAKPEERKALIRAYRERWRKEHMDRANESSRKSKAKRRRDPQLRRVEIEEKRAKRAVERQARRAAIVYTCAVCGTQWSPAVGRIPARAPKYCPNGTSCRGRANYQRGKAAGKRWALRTKEHRTDRRASLQTGTDKKEGNE